MNPLPSLIDGFEGIGWDLDGTLIDHPASSVLHALISKFPQKRHVLITFRTHGLRLRIERDLGAYPTAPNLAMFEAVHSISDRRWEAFEIARMQRKAGMLSGPLTPDEEYYVEWKGHMCQKLSLPVLVDDNTTHTKPGCERHGIVLLHPDQFM